MTATVLDDTDYAVLNVVVLKKMATAGSVAGATGLSEGEITQAFERLAEQGHVVDVGGSVLPGDGAEPALREAAESRYAAVRADPDVAALDEKFETVNSQFLGAMSSWQQIEVGGRKVTNDHSDPDYDEKVIARLDKLIQRLTSLIEALGSHDPRFGRYSERFTTAMQAIDSGQHDLVSSPTADSVHNIWFEFHEDLLRTLGRERTE
ncbi:hypothetical protein [Pseudonocardia endophytica]|uniref:Uncharacterized protein n=1 Tax=Pseudonocardia endophytica TaxID=401976 RepID=A0A4R1HM75_PSEEN|nr:hypothetical protein [Pseudonocardia endophytica]TCK21420.1 hypothetical protein EV378_5406 [Pseudonocardia endophytica]